MRMPRGISELLHSFKPSKLPLYFSGMVFCIVLLWLSRSSIVDLFILARPIHERLKKLFQDGLINLLEFQEAVVRDRKFRAKQMVDSLRKLEPSLSGEIWIKTLGVGRKKLGPKAKWKKCSFAIKFRILWCYTKDNALKLAVPLRNSNVILTPKRNPNYSRFSGNPNS